MEGYDDATARPGTPEHSPGRRRAEPAAPTEPVSPALERKAEALSRPDAHRAGRDVLGVLRAPSPAATPPETPAPPAPATTSTPPAPSEPRRAKPDRVKPARGRPARGRPARVKPGRAKPARVKRAPRPPAEPAVVEQPPPAQAAAPPARPQRTAPAVGVSTTVRFPPKRGARRLMGAVVLIVLVGAAGAGYLAYDDPSTLSIGIAGTLAVLLLVTWAVRTGTPLTRMAVKGGQLDVRSGGLHLKFDLTSHYTPIEVRGTPGRRGWRVLFGRGTTQPFVVDSSIVDPKEFMEVLRRYRPEQPE